MAQDMAQWKYLAKECKDKKYVRYIQFYYWTAGQGTDLQTTQHSGFVMIMQTCGGRRLFRWEVSTYQAELGVCVGVFFCFWKLWINLCVGRGAFPAAGEAQAGTYGRELSAACGVSWQSCTPRIWRCSDQLQGGNIRIKDQLYTLEITRLTKTLLCWTTRLYLLVKRAEGEERICWKLHWAKAVKSWQSTIQKNPTKS